MEATRPNVLTGQGDGQRICRCEQRCEAGNCEPKLLRKTVDSCRKTFESGSNIVTQVFSKYRRSLSFHKCAEYRADPTRRTGTCV